MQKNISTRFKIGFTIFASIFIILTTIDIILDNHSQTSRIHLLIEISLIFVVFITTIGIWLFFNQNLQNKQKHIEQLNQELAYFQAEFKDAIRILSEGVQKQLNSWGLSESEKKVAIALIRGYPVKQIAANLNRSERTIRNQGTAIYKKTGMTGRNDLAAFFLSELLPDPDED